MKTTTDRVRDYLTAVEREASALPADRRQELLADLAEHIEVTRAERPGAPVGEILAELGDPRAIAATALAEAGAAQGAAAAPAKRGKVHPLVPLLLLTLPYLVVTFFPDAAALQVVNGLCRITGAVLLCTSAHWAPVQKIVGILLAAILPMSAVIIWDETTVAPAGDLPALVANLIALAVITATCGWLWRTRRS